MLFFFSLAGSSPFLIPWLDILYAFSAVSYNNHVYDTENKYLGSKIR